MKKRGNSGTMDDATSKKHCLRENKSYHLFVDGLLVRVGNEQVNKEEQQDEGPLLAAMKKEYEKCIEKFTQNDRKREYYGRERIKLPYPNFLHDILARKQQPLIDLITANTLSFVFDGHARSFGLLNLCVLGGWIRACEYLQEIKIPKFFLDIMLELAAIGGHINACTLFPSENKKLSNIVQALKTAKRFGNAKFLSAATQIYKEEEQNLQATFAAKKRTRVPSHITYASQYPLPATTEAVIPSLLTICSHVVAAEAVLSPLSYAPLLSPLPSKLLELVCLKIAADGEKGYHTMTQLQVISPDLEKLIPTSVRVAASQTAEERTRQFTYEEFKIDTDFELPLINVFAEANSFVLAPPDDFESSATTLLPQPREPGAPSIVSHDQFLEQFKTLTEEILEDFDFSNVVVIGGSVIGSLLPIPAKPPSLDEEAKEDGDDEEEEEDKNEDKDEGEEEKSKKEQQTEETETKTEEVKDISTVEQHKHESGATKEEEALPPSTKEYYSSISPFKSSDIDLCIYGLTNEEFLKKLVSIYNHLKKKVGGREVKVYQSSSNVVLSALFPYRHVQISLISFRSIWHILTGVDIDCSAFAFDGTTLWASPRARLAVNHRWTIVDPNLYKIRGCPNYELRLVKYAKRGFTIVDPNLHLYESIAMEPEISSEDYSIEGITNNGSPSFFGAALVLAIVRWPRVARIMRRTSAKSGMPYGAKVGFEEIESYLEEYGEATNTGYGPSNSCPVEIAPEDLGNSDNVQRDGSGMEFMIGTAA